MDKSPLDKLTEIEEKLEKELKENEPQNNESPKKGPSPCCLGCFVPILIVILLFIGMCIYVYTQPYTKPIMTCLQNQLEIYEAIGRYKDLNNTYPESLKDLEKEYLKDKSVLYCPLDTKQEGYEYQNPEKVKGAKYITRCSRHILKEGVPFPPIIITPQGKFQYDMEAVPNTQNTIQDTQKQGGIK